MKYLRRDSDPLDVRVGEVLAHNVRWTGQRLGENGFRAFVLPLRGANVEPCDCPWPLGLAGHYRTVRVRDASR